MRTFTVIGAFTAKGCKTKFRDGTTYTAKKPAQAASKAFTELCRVKRVRGVAAYYVVLREKTQGSAKKEYSYLLHRNKLDTPLVRFAGTDKEFKIRYKNTIASKPVPKRRAKCKGKSAGPMKRASVLKGRGDEPFGANAVSNVEFPPVPKEPTKCDKYCDLIEHERLVLRGQADILERKFPDEQGVEPFDVDADRANDPIDCDYPQDCTKSGKNEIKQKLRDLVRIRKEQHAQLKDLGEWT